jgi:TetR/AcrR family transcriptional regulator
VAESYITNQSVINFQCPFPSSSAPSKTRHAQARAPQGGTARRTAGRGAGPVRRKGFAATRAEEVAARAGVSKGTLFLYFQSKEELFKAVISENIAGRFTEWNAEFDAFDGSTPTCCSTP